MQAIKRRPVLGALLLGLGVLALAAALYATGPMLIRSWTISQPLLHWIPTPDAVLDALVYLVFMLAMLPGMVLVSVGRAMICAKTT